MASPKSAAAPQSSGASGPAYAEAAPRTDPQPVMAAGGPAPADLRARWDAYQGHFAGPLTPLAGQPDLNVIANRVGPAVRTGVDFLFGPVLKLTARAGDAAQAILDTAWGDEDQRMTTLSKLRLNGGVYGHVLVKVVTPKNKRPISPDNPPRLVVQNPELYRLVTDPDDCELVTQYQCVWTDDDVQRMQTTTRVDPDDDDETVPEERDTDTHWEIQNWCRTSGAEDAWEPEGPVTLWPFAFAPLVDWQNYPNPNAHWGTPDVDESLVNLNRALHLVESNTASVIYSHGHPWLFASGADTGGITPTPGAITDLGSPDAKIWAVNAAGDVASMMQFAEQVRGDMDETISVPGVATGRQEALPRGALSGITVRLLYGPRLMRTEHERRLYGQGIRDLCRAVLILCGQQAAADAGVDLTWQDPLPQDDLAMAQMALALQQLGVSNHAIYALIGLNYDVEQEYKKQEQADQVTAFARGQGLPPATPVPPTPPQGPRPPAPQGGDVEGDAA